MCPNRSVVLQHDKLVALIYPDFDDAFAHGLHQEDIEKVMGVEPHRAQHPAGQLLPGEQSEDPF